MSEEQIERGLCGMWLGYLAGGLLGTYHVATFDTERAIWISAGLLVSAMLAGFFGAAATTPPPPAER